MSRICNKININPKKLYKGCIFCSVAHAVTAGEYPELNYEHSWDGLNYCMNNSKGCRGTITFGKKYIVAVFQDKSAKIPYRDAMEYFKGAPKAIVELAEAESLLYVLENMDGGTKPCITAAFWGTWEELYSTLTYDEIMKNSAHILAVQLMETQDALRACDDYYGLTDGQMDLILSLSEQRSQTDLSLPVILQKTDALYGDMDEISQSMEELNIKLSFRNCVPAKTDYNDTE